MAVVSSSGAPLWCSKDFSIESPKGLVLCHMCMHEFMRPPRPWSSSVRTCLWCRPWLSSLVRLDIPSHTLWITHRDLLLNLPKVVAFDLRLFLLIFQLYLVVFFRIISWNYENETFASVRESLSSEASTLETSQIKTGLDKVSTCSRALVRVLI